ncbi:hypothetical protein MANES_15G018500v8 [Manihot esculenta]|uniref:Uncharacterized protein n=1 Tax=Manihot esculenta TaxID=3983 RepID=A0ACB7G8R9_MANES|nr:hypothetical protein MANES_15G018500v8 [Manihot esculenta]
MFIYNFLLPRVQESRWICLLQVNYKNGILVGSLFIQVITQNNLKPFSLVSSHSIWFLLAKMKPNNFILLFISLLLLTVLNLSSGKDHGNKGGNGDHGKKHDHNNHGQGHGNEKESSCPQLERISRDITWRRSAANPALPAKLLRMHFHDCFGCDASILLDSTGGTEAEKEAVPNRSLAGFEVIDEIKAKAEEECPGLVSCADIVALAARDAVAFQFRRSLWPVSFGRKDGRVSLASEANATLPSPAANFATLRQQFQSLGLDVVDLVALSGAHTIGVSHCAAFSDRIFNFTGKGDTDPSLDPDYANFLKQKCSNPPSLTTTVDMDPGSSLSFDSHYFEALFQNKGLFQSDATLLTDPEAARLSRTFQNQGAFFARFGQSMVKMGSIVSGEEGEIRKNCRVVN